MSAMGAAAYIRYRVIIREYPNLPLEQRAVLAEAAAVASMRQLRAMVLGLISRRSR